MPYINEDRRNLMNPDQGFPENPGELNYMFTVIAKQYMGDHESYQRYNDVIGALEACKLELYRRMVAPYEDVKILQNGDV